MKVFFLGAFIVLLVLTGIACLIPPPYAAPGKIPLVWCSDDNPARREQIALFNRLHTNYRLRLDPTNMDRQKIIVQSVGGVGPDLFDCYGSSDTAAYVKSGIAWDVTDELLRLGIDMKRDVWPPAYSIVAYKGRIYGFPTNAGSFAVFYNKDLFDRAHVPYPKGPWKWDEMVELARKLTVKGEDGRTKQYGLLFDTGIAEQFIRQWGGSTFSPDNTRSTVDSPEAVAGLQFMADLMFRYKVAPTPSEISSMPTTGGWGSGQMTLFGSGFGAMMIGGRWNICRLRESPNLHLGVVECPHYKKEYRVFRGVARATFINNDSPNREHALKFLLYMAGKDYNELVNRDADGVSAVKRYTYTGEYLHDPKYPMETYNDVWRDTMNYTFVEQVSPFVKPEIAGRYFNNQLDLIFAGQKTAEEGMKRAAAQTNEAIRKTISEEPSLKAEYDKLTGGGAR